MCVFPHFPTQYRLPSRVTLSPIGALNPDITTRFGLRAPSNPPKLRACPQPATEAKKHHKPAPISRPGDWLFDFFALTVEESPFPFYKQFEHHKLITPSPLFPLPFKTVSLFLI
jgi:hypothetical protein